MIDPMAVLELRRQGAVNRRQILSMVQTARSGHLGGSLSAIDILTTLYFHSLRVDPTSPDDPSRDRFVLSKGHASPALYTTLAARGFFPAEELAGFRKIEGNLSGHTEMRSVPGVDMSTGSLGQGLSAAVGMALAGRVDGQGYRVFAMLGDGEIQEGQIWEAAMAAGHYGLGNLIVFVDNNGLQIDGPVAEVMSPYPIPEKFAAFGWHTLEIDGHDVAAIVDAIDQHSEDAPTAIIASTTKGKGVSFMENNVAWHGSLPTAEQFELAFAEIDRELAELGVVA